MGIYVLVPSRGRPESMRRLTEAFARTIERSTYVHWILDRDDPRLEDYRDTFEGIEFGYKSLWVVPSGGRPGIVDPLNFTVNELLEDTFSVSIDAFGFMGDDHLPKTVGWDSILHQELLFMNRHGILYGDDLLQGERLPTAAFISSDIVEAWGVLAPPELQHLWVDDFWKQVGLGAECLKFVPSVVIEHLHYSVGKSGKDETYETVNDSKLASRDRAMFEVLRRSGKLQEYVNLAKDAPNIYREAVKRALEG